MATELAPVTPSVLRWARESIGVNLEDAAKRAGVTAERIQAWEDGQAEPTVAKLRLLAKLYQRPLSVFFLPDPPIDYETLRDFRRLPGEEDRSWSRKLHKVYRRAVQQQEIARELLEGEEEQLSGMIPAVSLDEDPDETAQTARRALQVPLTDQFSWRHPEDAFSGWLEAVEDLGVLVLRTSDVPMSEMRGFSIGSEPAPVIVVNALDSPRGQVFTLAHEFVHLMLREGGLCDLLEPIAGMGRRVELFCNAVAGAVLMPAEALLDELGLDHTPRPWQETELEALAGRYGVSREAVLRRLVTLNAATWDFYLAKRNDYMRAYAEHREQERVRRRASTGGPPPFRMAVRDRGKPYVRMVLDAYHRDIITPSTLSNFLGLKLKHLAALEREMRASR